MMNKPEDVYGNMRRRMVDEQIRGRNIKDPKVIQAFLDVSRERFVPTVFESNAYADNPLPIGCGQTISQPYMVAVMTECLKLKGGEKVLEIGTGSGYQAAILAKICREVFTVERTGELKDKARQALLEERFSNIVFKRGDGTGGWEEAAPFDGIIVTAGAPDVPEPLKHQLAAGGRLVIPVGSMYRQMLLVIEKRGTGFVQEEICSCVFVPLIGEYGWPEDSK